MLTLKNVKIETKKNKTLLINNFSFNFLPGLNYITGMSGAGKSTLLDAIAQMSEHEISGSFMYCGNDIDCQDVAYVRTSAEIYGFFSFNQLIHFYSSFAYIDMDRKDKLLKLITDVNKDNKIITYSTGQKKRCKLILDLLLKKKIVCLDEPYANLCKADQRLVTEIIYSILNFDKSVIFIIATHHESCIMKDTQCIKIEDRTIYPIHEKIIPYEENNMESCKVTYKYHTICTRLRNLLYLEYHYCLQNNIRYIAAYFCVIFLIVYGQICMPLYDDFSITYKVINLTGYGGIIISQAEWGPKFEYMYPILLKDIKIGKILALETSLYFIIVNMMHCFIFGTIYFIGLGFVYSTVNLPIYTSIMFFLATWCTRMIIRLFSLKYGDFIFVVVMYFMSTPINYNNGFAIDYDECNIIGKVGFFLPPSMVVSIAYDELFQYNPIGFGRTFLFCTIFMYCFLLCIGVFYFFNSIQKKRTKRNKDVEMQYLIVNQA